MGSQWYRSPETFVLVLYCRSCGTGQAATSSSYCTTGLSHLAQSRCVFNVPTQGNPAGHMVAQRTSRGIHTLGMCAHSAWFWGIEPHTCHSLGHAVDHSNNPFQQKLVKWHNSHGCISGTTVWLVPFQQKLVKWHNSHSWISTTTVWLVPFQQKLVKWHNSHGWVSGTTV